MGKDTSPRQPQVLWGSLGWKGAACVPLLGKADLMALCHGIPGAGSSESWESWVEEEEEEEEDDTTVAEGGLVPGRGKCIGSPLGLWGHTKPEKLVLSSLELGNFTCDRLAHPASRRGGV